MTPKIRLRFSRLARNPEAPLFGEIAALLGKRKTDCLIPNDDHWKLDGSEPDVEKMIAEGISGGQAFPDGWHFMYIIEKTE